jgi:hypothetical protein
VDGRSLGPFILVGVGHALEEPHNLFTGLETVYRPVSSHGDRGDTVERGDLIAIKGGKGIVVSIEERRHLGFKGRRHCFLASSGLGNFILCPHETTGKVAAGREEQRPSCEGWFENSLIFFVGSKTWM